MNGRIYVCGTVPDLLPLERSLKCLFVTCVQDSSGTLLSVTVLCCSLEYHSQMVSDAVKRVIKQGKVSVYVSKS